MSCGTSCGSCGDEASDATAAPVTPTASSSRADLERRVLDAQKTWSIPLSDESRDKWDIIFNDIGMELSGGYADSLRPLVGVFDLFDAQAYLAVARACCAAVARDNDDDDENGYDNDDDGIVGDEPMLMGKQLAWAFVHCEGDVARFRDAVLAADADMLAYVADYARFDACFAPRAPDYSNTACNEKRQHEAITEEGHDIDAAPAAASKAASKSLAHRRRWRRYALAAGAGCVAATLLYLLSRRGTSANASGNTEALSDSSTQATSSK
jgi:hypothetical protein